MPDFAYTALAMDGRTTTGVIDAPSAGAAAARVEALGLVPVEVADGAAAGSPAVSRKPRTAAGGGAASGRTRPVKARQVNGFMRQLSSLLTAGVPLSKALGILGRESSAPGAAALWRQINDRVSDGSPLADAMAEHPKVFPDVQVAMVRAGETGGFLDVVLKQIADFMARERELKGRVVGAMIYPAVLAVVALGVVVFLLMWFIPQFSKVFDEFGRSLPWITQVVQAASRAVLAYGLYGVVAVGVLGFVARQALLSEAGRRFRDRHILRVPAVGRVLGAFALVRFCRLLGTLIGAGVPLIQAITVSKQAIGNQVLGDALDDAVQRVQQGETLAGALAACPDLFPPSVTEVVAVAEESGALDAELVRLADEYEHELDARLRMLVSLAEPLLLFVMAALVGTIVVGMLLPVFDLWDAIQ